MRKSILGLFTIAILMAATPALAAITVYTPGIDGTGYNADAAFNTFSAMYNGSLQTETFENVNSAPNAPIDPVNGLGVAFGTITSTSRPGDAVYIATKASVQGGTGETPLNRLYLSNGDPTSREGKKGDFTLSLDTGHRALGFYATDWHDCGGSVVLEVAGEGWADTIDISVRQYIGNLANDTMVYFSFFSDMAFDTVTFKASGQDGYGIDNLSVAAPTPIPGAVWLFGTGLLGLVGLRRRRA